MPQGATRSITKPITNTNAMTNSEPNYKNLKYIKDAAVVTISLNRPDSANGLNTALAADLASASKRCADDASVKAVILTGEGRFFCAGGVIQAMADFGDQVSAGLKGLADDLHKAISTFARMDAPLIVAVNGTAAGAGLSMAVTGDLVLAAESAKFTMAYTKAGLSPDGSSSYYLPRLIGLRRTQELMYCNRVLSAAEAQQWGLINKVVAEDDLLDEARKLAAMFTKGAKGANAAVKQLLSKAFDNSLETQMELEGVAIAENAGSSDGLEGVAAFLEKRAPKFD